MKTRKLVGVRYLHDVNFAKFHFNFSSFNFFHVQIFFDGIWIKGRFMRTATCHKCWNKYGAKYVTLFLGMTRETVYCILAVTVTMQEPHVTVSNLLSTDTIWPNIVDASIKHNST